MQQATFRIAPSPDGEMELSDLIPQESFTSDDHTELNKTFFQTPDETVQTGVWECAPCRMEFDDYPFHEMMTVISGSVTLTHADGHAETFTTGDVFFLAKGTQCTWHVTETLRKFYMIVS